MIREKKRGEAMFKRYRNINGNSNVNSYEIGPDYIDVIFNGTRKVYRYSYRKAGRIHVEKMKALAERGYGLNSYINLYCRELYD